jgi:hypothetical protein
MFLFLISHYYFGLPKRFFNLFIFVTKKKISLHQLGVAYNMGQPNVKPKYPILLPFFTGDFTHSFDNHEKENYPPSKAIIEPAPT